jgi:sugar phosphate isomerase/epimerase
VTLSRREFLWSAAAGAAALSAAPAAAIDPIERPAGKPWMRLSLAAYSFRQLLDLKKKPAPAMTLFDFIDFAAGLPLDAVELTSYYFADTSDAYLAKLKAHCTRLGLDVSGVPVGNDFCLRDPGKHKEQIDSVKAWTERAAKLGAKTVRIFAGRVEKGDDEAEARRRCVAALEECAEYAGKFGVYLALENHGGVTATPAELLGLVKPVKSPFLGVNIDTGNFHGADPYAEVAEIAPYGVCVQVKTEVSPAGGKKSEADLKRFVDILRAANYRGYVALEYEAAEDPRAAVPRYVAELRKLV